MVVGLHGVLFANVARAVEEVANTSIENAKTHHLNMAENCAQDHLRCHVSATHSHVQLMVRGLHGVCLDRAARLVEEV